jgi:tellurite resistance protein
LIDPSLKVGRVPNRSGDGLTYWPGYGTISPDSRAAYLEWLAYGRCDPQTPIGYVFLYFYGLERRVLVDCSMPGPAQTDLPVLRSEIARLLSIYGGNYSFRGYATGLLSIVDLLLGRRVMDPPVFSGEKWPIPLELRMRLGELSRSQTPIPASWALAWALFHPEIYPRTPATRCPQQFTRLFRARYAAAFGSGLLVKPNKATVSVEYRPASSGLPPVGWDSGLPDIFQLSATSKRLAAIVEECTDALDAYSRWLGRHPESEETLAATALLPPALIDSQVEPVKSLLHFAEQKIAGSDYALIDGADLKRLWSSGGAVKLSKQDSTALAVLLGNLAIGVEPDPRFGGGAIGEGSTVLFRLDRDDAISAASAEYTTAATLLRLAAAVASADTTSTAEQGFLLGHLETVLDLSSAEIRRLRAHLRLLYAMPVKLTGLTARLASLGRDDRERIAKFCIAVAAADGVVAPSEVATLSKIYTLLEMPKGRVFQDIHAAVATSTVPATEPVTVRPAGKQESGHTIPARPTPTQSAPRPGLVLDQAAVAAKLAETAKVSALLGSIFSEEEERELPQFPATPVPPDVRLYAGLDAAHSQLLGALAAKPEWTRAAVEVVCADLGLLPDGAVDTLNDAAFESVGQPVIEGGDLLEVDIEAVQEMQR